MGYKKGDVVRWNIYSTVGIVRRVREQRGRLGRGHELMVEPLINTHGCRVESNGLIRIHDSQVGPLTLADINRTEAYDVTRKVPLGYDFDALRKICADFGITS